MAIKKFAKGDLRECLWGGQGPLIEEEDTITDTGRWSIHHLLTFKEKESGKYYQVAYSRGATESQDERPFEDDDDEIECQEVRKVQKLVDVWEEVDG